MFLFILAKEEFILHVCKSGNFIILCVFRRSESPKEEWELLCCTAEEWEELTESFHGSKQSYERQLYKALNDELLPDVLQAIAAKVCSIVCSSMCVCVCSLLSTGLVS